ncbi:molybdenum cofactor guanylyltransferase [Paenibacillus lautus]|uniref:Probable molybdenum cofactor guanylyltransferase n=1 Tax=Paenibacillus lautus TaxID=1401 RepID=A0A385U223_PAELA|nr:molybdenum cofactor guanylyltransferase [Paenibacillus lautus]AYB47665.1 molybdenum cofactor guanylyltransferase [Paenibacillus lautus]
MSAQSQDVRLPSGQVTGIVLAGGASRRMGRNKALLPMEGMSLIERTVHALDKVSGRVILSANDPGPYQFLGLECVPDLYVGQGPMAGLHAALKSSRSTWNLVAACDMPYIHERFLQGLLDLANMQDTADAIIPVVEGRMHPLLAAYRREAAESLERRLIRGQLRMVEWVQELNAVFANEEELAEVTGLDPRRILFNMNTPVDYKAAGGLLNTEE